MHEDKFSIPNGELVVQTVTASGTTAINPNAHIVAVTIPASGNVVLTPPGVGADGVAERVIYVAEDLGSGNVQMSYSGIDGGLATAPTFDNLTAKGDYWVTKNYNGLILKVPYELSTP